MQRAVEALGLRQGPVHAEVRLNPEGVWMVELAPRTVGGLCSRSLHFPDGESLEMRVIRNALSMEPQHREPRDQNAAASGVMMIPVAKEGRLQAVRGVDVARRVAGIDDVIVSVPVGDRVVPLPEGDRYLGFIFARGPSPLEVEQALRTAREAIEIVIAG